MLIKGFKVKLKPNRKQFEKLFGCVGVSRWAYNYTLQRVRDHHKDTGKFLLDGLIRKEITQLKKTDEFSWLNEYSCDIMKQSVKDACKAFKSFFKGKTKFPRFKSRRKSKPSFYEDTHKIRFQNGKVKLSKIGWVKLTERDRIPQGKFINPRITFDGVDWFISIGVEVQNKVPEIKSEGIGIDVGIKNLAIVSDGRIFPNVNKTDRVRKTKKSLKRLQRQASRQYQMNKQGNGFVKTNNIRKTECKIRKKYIHLTNIRKDHLHKTITTLARTKPEFVVVEDLNISGMMKNRCLSKAIQEQGLHEFFRQLKYKCQWNDIPFHQVDRFFPSSKTCNSCETINRDLKLKDRIFECPSCGYIEDRDLNAAYNLRDQYPEFRGNLRLRSVKQTIVATAKSDTMKQELTNSKSKQMLDFRSF